MNGSDEIERIESGQDIENWEKGDYYENEEIE